MTLAKVYDPHQVEAKWYAEWESQGYFSSQSNSPPIGSSHGIVFSMVIPPPNVTGYLHMGHALNNTIQDILARYHRMRGDETLWIPGTDHAGIATQNVVERALAKEGKKREDLGREEFVRQAWEWKEQYGGQITRQLRRLGTSCDWKRERFTLDPGLSKAVRHAFVSLYEEGLIYRGKYLVNWCPRCHTAISDIEVDHEASKGHLWYIRYPLAEDPHRHVVVATTRPETMVGDMAVAVHPDDERYRSFIGKVLTLPLTDRVIPVIADSLVDPQFGTGAVKVTPAHDANDFEMAGRHHLEKRVVIDAEGKMTAAAGKYHQQDRFHARKEIVNDLAEQGYLEKTEDYQVPVGRCYRCKTVIEPRLSDQWFVKVAPLAAPAIRAVESGEIRFVPERWTKVYLHWMRNLKDWCISRQLWWGHRIPVWYCQNQACQALVVSREDPTTCDQCGQGFFKQDEDVLDTWFSSQLWPFSTCGWPEETGDLARYYPTSVLVTGYDIISFWVSKMIMMGLHFMRQKPFSVVYVHGLVRDAEGKKMSKSTGNVVDPLDVLKRHGTDALRFALTSLITAQGQDLKLSDEKILESRNFANKLWNVARFLLLKWESLGGVEAWPSLEKETLPVTDRWILSRYHETVQAVTNALTSFSFGEAARRLYEFLWGEYCDWYVELSKVALESADEPTQHRTFYVLFTVLEGTLRLLHPFMPYVTEEIWQKLTIIPQENAPVATIMLAPWPEVGEGWIDPQIDQEMGLLIGVIRTIRNIRAEMHIPHTVSLQATLVALQEQAFLSAHEADLKRLARLDQLQIVSQLVKPPHQSAYGVAGPCEIYLALGGIIDVAKEMARLQNEMLTLKKEFDKLTGRLENADFIKRAPEEIVQKERARQAELTAQLSLLTRQLQLLS